MLHSSKSCSPFDIVLFYVIMYDSLNKNLLVITDFYFNMFSKGIRIFLQYNQRWYPATALKPSHIRRFYPCNIRYFLLRHFLAVSLLH